VSKQVRVRERGIPKSINCPGFVFSESFEFIPDPTGQFKIDALQDLFQNP